VIESHLALDRSNAILSRLGLQLSRYGLLLQYSQLLSSVHFIHQSASVSTFGLTSKNLGLLGHLEHLNSNKDSSGSGGEESKYSNPVGSPRDGQSLSRDGEGLYLKRFEIVPSNQLHQYWLRWSKWFWVIVGLINVWWSGRLLWRGSRWLSDRATGELSFLLALVGFLFISHGFGLL